MGPRLDGMASRAEQIKLSRRFRSGLLSLVGNGAAERGSRLTTSAGLEVRIHLSPAKSLQTFGSWRASSGPGDEQEIEVLGEI
jgi:hypothetical protein